MINVQMAVTVVVHAFIGLLFYAGNKPFFYHLFGAVLLLNIIGLVLIRFNIKKVGTWVFLISSLGAILPIGIIGAMGAKKLLQELKEAETTVVRE